MNQSANSIYNASKGNLPSKLEVGSVHIFNRVSKTNTKLHSSSKKYRSEHSERSEDDHKRGQKLFFQYHCENSKNILANMSQPLMSVKTADAAKDTSMYSIKRELETKSRILRSNLRKKRSQYIGGSANELAKPTTVVARTKTKSSSDRNSLNMFMSIED